MIYLFGINPVARYLIYELRGRDGIELIVDDEYFQEEKYLEFNVRKLSNVSVSSVSTVYNCVGYRDLGRRREIGDYFFKKGILGTFLSPNAKIHSSTNVSDGAIIFDNVHIEMNCSIGMHTIMWSGSRVCHDSQIGIANFHAAGSIIGGQCTIGNECFFGFNSSVIQRTTVGNNICVKANSFFQ